MLPTDLFIWECINSPTLAFMSRWHMVKPQGHFLMLSYKLVSDTHKHFQKHTSLILLGLLQNTAVLFFLNWHVFFFFPSAITCILFVLIFKSSSHVHTKLVLCESGYLFLKNLCGETLANTASGQVVTFVFQSPYKAKVVPVLGKEDRFQTQWLYVVFEHFLYCLFKFYYFFVRLQKRLQVLQQRCFEEW